MPTLKSVRILINLYILSLNLMDLRAVIVLVSINSHTTLSYCYHLFESLYIRSLCAGYSQRLNGYEIRNLKKEIQNFSLSCLLHNFYEIWNAEIFNESSGNISKFSTFFWPKTVKIKLRDRDRIWEKF